MEFTDIKISEIEKTTFGVISKGVTHNFYELKEAPFSKEEKEFANLLSNIIMTESSVKGLAKYDDLAHDFEDNFREQIITIVNINRLLEKIPSKSIFNNLKNSLKELIKDLDFIKDKEFFAKYVLHNSIGLKQLSFFSLEDDFEELLVNDLSSIFVFHKKHGYCKTDVVLEEKAFENLIIKIAKSIGKDFDNQSPLLDARLPDGSRVNATMKNVSPRSTSLTIRKFSKIPITILDLIKSKTISLEASAFLWMMVDGFGINPQNILIVGGTASGKTTMLDILSNFIRLNQRIVTIEDTLEIYLLNRENHVALEAKTSKDEDISMDDLLKNSLRMRPDRIVVGEVRGKEALTLFTAMDNGHAGVLGTLHANSAREAINKLEERPFVVPGSMLPLLDLVVVMKRTYDRELGIKRNVVEISEIARMENKVLLANVFEHNRSKEELTRTDLPSHILEKFANQNSMSKNEIKKEIETRKIILKWMIEKEITKPKEVLEVIQSYYFDPKKVIDMIYH
jgi:flagellar protein FlaI